MHLLLPQRKFQCHQKMQRIVLYSFQILQEIHFLLSLKALQLSDTVLLHAQSVVALIMPPQQMPQPLSV